MRDSVPSASYSSVCNVLRQWNILLIPTYRVYRLYDIFIFIFNSYFSFPFLSFSLPVLSFHSFLETAVST